VAGFFLEPVQGERGVYVPPVGYLTKVREICTRYGVALVLDEIQTGLGRTGRMFCCEHEGVSPDVMLLSKALGGGLVPIGACLISGEYWDSRFALSHSSTFANNNVTCAVAMAVVETLEKENLCERAAVLGARLMNGLQDLARRYPKVIAEVRGKGLLCAVQFHAATKDQGAFLSYMSHQSLLAYGIASVLAELEGILVLPTLNNGNVLRIAPPLIVTEAQIDTILSGFERVVKLLENNEVDVFVRTIGRLHEPREPIPSRILKQARPLDFPPKAPAPANNHSYAFLMHYTRLKDIPTTDPALKSLSQEELERYCNFIADMPPGVVYEAPLIRSATGVEVKGYLIAIGMLPDEMYRRGRGLMEKEISRAVDIASNLGVRVVGLGAFTSVFSRRGTTVAGRVPVVTTGNILTAAMGFAAIERVMERRGRYIKDAVVGVVGAKGSIGSLCAKLLARSQPKEIVLVGNPNSNISHLEQIEMEIRELTRCPVSITDNFDDLAKCDIVLSATSSSQPVLDTAPIKSGAIVCDVARPPDASEVLRERPDITVIDGGLVALPDPTVRFGVGNIQGFPDGIQLACLSETILLSMAQVDRDMGLGENVTLDEVDEIVALARKHGFGLAEPEMDELDYMATIKPVTGRG
ncbi:MAG: aminotransferase class III-fold pyridoxal phosphate-dependent enzyme, partial [Gammaproteobacteria bacterium]|nr:aminotransferase class III-fold pyridoxal phosphate-dependent enzyme [Gammaproteobacteria bacterium]